MGQKGISPYLFILFDTLNQKYLPLNFSPKGRGGDALLGKYTPLLSTLFENSNFKSAKNKLFETSDRNL